MTTSPPPTVAVAENRLLAALPPADYDRVRAQTTVVSFDLREIAYQAGGPMDFSYFPQSGVMSMVVMASGVMSEVGIIGREGMLGV